MNKAPNRIRRRFVGSLVVLPLAATVIAAPAASPAGNVSLLEAINQAGRQRMLSQRMSKFYFFIAGGIDTPEIRTGLDTARKDFLASMQALRRAPENTKDTESWLKLAEMQWMFFDDALRGSGKSHETAYLENNVAVSSENILQVMDKLTGLYATLG